MNRQETHDSICVLLEEYTDADVETVAEQLLALLGLLGEDLLDALDPPPGLQHWLISHGLSLVATVEGRSTQVWEALEAGDEEAPETDLEGEEGDSPPLQVGDYVEYRTAPSGPHHHSSMGSGRIVAIHPETQTPVAARHDMVVVITGPGQPEVWLDSETDVIRPLQSPGETPPRSAEAPPW